MPVIPMMDPELLTTDDENRLLPITDITGVPASSDTVLSILSSDDDDQPVLTNHIPALIGMVGRAGAGKDTAARYLHKRFTTQTLSFAGALKEGCRHIFRFTDDQLYGSDKMTVDPYWGTTPRAVLQMVGTELFRNTLPTLLAQSNIRSDIWIQRLNLDIVANQRSGVHTVISDVRFHNEAEFIRSTGGVLIRITRPDIATMDHSSENSINALIVDHDIDNNDGLRDFYRALETALNLAPASNRFINELILYEQDPTVRQSHNCAGRLESRLQIMWLVIMCMMFILLAYFLITRSN